MKVRRIYISREHNYFGHYGEEPGTEPMLALSEVHCVAGSGLEGDRFFNYKPDYDGQVTFFSWGVYEDLCAAFGVQDKEPSVFRRNLIVTEADLPALIGQEFSVQGIHFLGRKEATPCDWMDLAFHPGAKEALQGKGGLRARVLTDGILRLDS